MSLYIVVGFMVYMRVPNVYYGGVIIIIAFQCLFSGRHEQPLSLGGNYMINVSLTSPDRKMFVNKQNGCKHGVR